MASRIKLNNWPNSDLKCLRISNVSGSRHWALYFIWDEASAYYRLEDSLGRSPAKSKAWKWREMGRAMIQYISEPS